METELCGLAPMDWQIRSVEDVCLRVTSGGTPSRSEPSYYTAGSWPWVKTQELQDEWLDDTEEHITDQAVASSSAKVLPANTVLVAMYGATVGQLGLLRRPMTCNQACCALIVDPAEADYRYLFFQLLHARSQLKNLATGAAQQNLSGIFIRALRFPFPPLPEQRAIAHILGTLADKIELNRRMNETLESMARALFNSWFVDFDPVRAKSEGHRPSGMDTDTAKLFANEFVESALGPIPKGWRVGTLGDLGTIVTGKTPPKAHSEYFGKGYPFIKIPDMHGQLWVSGAQEELSEAGHAFQLHKLVPPLSVAVSCIATVGLVALVRRPSHTNQQINTVVPGEGISSYWAFLALRGLGHIIESRSLGGSVTKNLNKGQFESIPLLIPPAEIQCTFERAVADIFGLIAIRDDASATLVAIHDALLPRLLSGELSVSPTERVVEANT